jgi:hypothetical protein
MSTLEPIFKQNSVKILDSDDFNLSQASLSITLSTLKDCILILFHSNNLESEELSIIWEKAAENAPGITWAAVNLKTEKKIARAFTNLTGDEPYFWAKLKQIPFILVYRQGFPVAFYNGARETQTLVDYALDLACSPNYHERLQVGKSTLSDDRSEMTGYRAYKFGEDRKVSGEFSADKSLRGFDSSVAMRQYAGTPAGPPPAGAATAKTAGPPAATTTAATGPPAGTATAKTAGPPAATTTAAAGPPAGTTAGTPAEAISGNASPMFEDQKAT